MLCCLRQAMPQKLSFLLSINWLAADASCIFVRVHRSASAAHLPQDKHEYNHKIMQTADALGHLGQHNGSIASQPLNNNNCIHPNSNYPLLNGTRQLPDSRGQGAGLPAFLLKPI